MSADLVLPCEWHMDEGEWYATTIAHWTGNIKDDDNDGVLGGWGEVDVEDAKGSFAFACECLRDGATIASPIQGYRALDCGAGVGRVTKDVLIRVAENVELVEVSDKLLSQAKVQVCK
jgi:protein N-terminal methyltransferase